MIRTTQDSDIITEMQAKHIQPFVSSLQNEFFIDEEMIADAIRRNSSFNIIHRDTMFKVDIFIPHQRPFQQSQLARANGKPLNLKLNKALILPVQKILSCQNLNGIDWAERYQKDNGAIFLGS